MNEQELAQLLKDFKELQREVEELKKWKAERERRQLTYPLDPQSQKIIQQLP